MSWASAIREGASGSSYRPGLRRSPIGNAVRVTGRVPPARKLEMIESRSAKVRLAGMRFFDGYGRELCRGSFHLTLRCPLAKSASTTFADARPARIKGRAALPPWLFKIAT